MDSSNGVAQMVPYLKGIPVQWSKLYNKILPRGISLYEGFPYTDQNAAWDKLYPKEQSQQSRPKYMGATFRQQTYYVENKTVLYSVNRHT